MRVTIKDAEALRAIPPREVAAYLRARGWHEVKRMGEKGAIWTPGGDPTGDIEVLLPLDRDLRDFALRMGEVLRALETVEDRSQTDILDDILATSADLIRVRLDRHDVTDGTIPLEAGAGLIARVRDLVAAAACAAVSPRACFQARRPSQATSYIQNVRLGQTEHGSYVVTVVSKVPPELDVKQPQLPPVPAEEPFERRVISTLASGLATLRTASDTAAATGALDAFQAAVDEGVSANLCEAIADIGGDPAVRQLDFTISWAPARPPARELPSRVSFPSDTIPIIREAGRLLRASVPQGDVEVRGVVTECKRTPGDHFGEVTVLGIVVGQDQPRRVHVALAAQDYLDAVAAHADHRSVVCYGSLYKEGQTFVLRNPRFAVANDM